MMQLGKNLVLASQHWPNSRADPYFRRSVGNGHLDSQLQPITSPQDPTPKGPEEDEEVVIEAIVFHQIQAEFQAFRR